LLYPNDSSIIALATDLPPSEKMQLPILDLNDINEIADFIKQRYLKH